MLIVTPFYHEITGRDVDPIVKEMWKHEGYIRASSAIPILEGAIPACLYEEGEGTPVELDKREKTPLLSGCEKNPATQEKRYAIPHQLDEKMYN